jgi:hypothetical protein
MKSDIEHLLELGNEPEAVVVAVDREVREYEKAHDEHGQGDRPPPSRPPEEAATPASRVRDRLGAGWNETA